jgi:glutamate racemase
MVMKIGIFDSGIGGRNILAVLRREFPDFEFIYISDQKNLPYGLKSAEIVRDLTSKAIQPLVEQCQIIVIACNTATTLAIDHLRATFPNVKFIGLEPMIRPAAKTTKTGAICVCATPATLKSRNYAQLKSLYTQDIKVVEPNCATWAELIERGKSDQIDLEPLKLSTNRQNCNVLVLGCTHYHALIPKLRRLLPEITIFEPSDAIVERVKSLL